MSMTTTLIRVDLPSGDDDPTSLHVKTFRELSKAGTPPTPFASPNLSSESNTESLTESYRDEDNGSNNLVAEESALSHSDSGESVLRLCSDGVGEKMSPQHLQGVESQTPAEHQPSLVNDELEDSAPELLPSNPMHTRRLSSSIPHLLSNAASASVTAGSSEAAVGNREANNPLQHQLSFAGLDAVLPPLDVARSDLSFPVDGNNSGYVISHNNMYTTPPVQAIVNPGRVISPLHLTNNQCTTTFSQTSFYGTTPPIGVGVMPGQSPLTPSSSQLQFGIPSSIHTEAGQQPTISPVTRTNIPATQQQYYQSSRNQHIVQHVLYSAINSLEKYNAGSFDNRIMLAKARGKYSNGKAFPGVPIRPLNDERNGNIKGCSKNNSAEESKGCVAPPAAPSIIQEGVTHINSNQLQPASDTVVGKPEAGRHSSIIKSNGIIKSRSDQNFEYDATNEKPIRRTSRRDKSVTIDQNIKKNKRREKKIGVFRPSCDAYTPRMANRPIKYKPAQERTSVEKMSTTMGTIQRPNFRDALRRVAIILHQHIVKIEQRFETGVRGADDTGLFKASMREMFKEDLFVTPTYRCCMVRVPMARPGVVYSMRKIRNVYNTPTTDEIYDFAHQLFKKVQLSSECSIVCLIYVEKLMEVAKVPLLSDTWRPIFMCGLLLASKVWQDLSSWNIEFASVYPQFSLDAINRLELQFLKMIKWDLYISSSLYAKYYFALRSLLEKSGFRDRYNQMVGGLGGIAASEAMKVSKRSEAVKEEALLHLSRSM